MAGRMKHRNLNKAEKSSDYIHNNPFYRADKNVFFRGDNSLFSACSKLESQIQLLIKDQSRQSTTAIKIALNHLRTRLDVKASLSIKLPKDKQKAKNTLGILKSVESVSDQDFLDCFRERLDGLQELVEEYSQKNKDEAKAIKPKTVEQKK
jgi:hypothetical protein